MNKQAQLDQAFAEGFAKESGMDLGELEQMVRRYMGDAPTGIRRAAVAAPIGAGLAGLYGLLAPTPKTSKSDPRFLRALRYALVGGVGAGGLGLASDPDVLGRLLSFADQRGDGSGAAKTLEFDTPAPGTGNEAGMAGGSSDPNALGLG